MLLDRRKPRRRSSPVSTSTSDVALSVALVITPPPTNVSCGITLRSASWAIGGFHEQQHVQRDGLVSVAEASLQGTGSLGLLARWWSIGFDHLSTLTTEPQFHAAVSKTLSVFTTRQFRLEQTISTTPNNNQQRSAESYSSTTKSVSLHHRSVPKPSISSTKS